MHEQQGLVLITTNPLLLKRAYTSTLLHLNAIMGIKRVFNVFPMCHNSHHC